MAPPGGKGGGKGKKKEKSDNSEGISNGRAKGDSGHSETKEQRNAFLFGRSSSSSRPSRQSTLAASGTLAVVNNEEPHSSNAIQKREQKNIILVIINTKAYLSFYLPFLKYYVAYGEQEKEDRTHRIPLPLSPNPVTKGQQERTQYPRNEIGYDINHQYRPYFKYLHHFEPSKIKTVCLLQSDDDGAGERPCGQTISIPIGNYFNMKRHLKDVHKIYSLDKEKNEDLSLAKRYPRNHPMQNEFDGKVKGMMREGLPIGFVTKRSFHDFVSFTGRNRFSVKSRQAFTVKIENDAKIKVDLDQLLRDVPLGGVHLTLDIWTHVRRTPALGIKAHYIDERFRHHVKTIALVEFEAAHTGENIRQKVEDVLKELKFHFAQLGLVITDNASNMKKAFNMRGIFDKSSDVQWIEEPVLEEIGDNDDQSDTERNDNNIAGEDDYDSDSESECEDADEQQQNGSSIQELIADLQKIHGNQWNGCQSHTAQLSINRSIEEDEKTKNILEHVNQVVSFFRHSNKWEAIYRKEVKEMCTCPLDKRGQKPRSHDLKLRNKTRWNSCLHAVHRLTRNDAFKVAQSIMRRVNAGRKEPNKKPPPLMPDDMHAQLVELADIMKPIQVLTDRLQQDGPTCHIAIISATMALRALQKMEVRHFKLFRDLLVLNLKKKFDVLTSNTWFQIGAVLDPRQKLETFRMEWKENQVKPNLPIPENVEKLILTELELEKARESAEETEKDGPSPAKKSRSETESSLFADLGSTKEVDGNTNSANLELQKYLSEAREHEKCNVLEFWRDNAFRFPLLSRLVRRVLSIPASTGSVERLFSVAGILKSKQRSNMRLELVEVLIIQREEDEVKRNEER